MKVRELIKQLLEEDMDMEVLIEASSQAYSNHVPIEGISIWSPNDSITLVPEVRLTSNADINS